MRKKNEKKYTADQLKVTLRLHYETHLLGYLLNNDRSNTVYALSCLLYDCASQSYYKQAMLENEPCRISSPPSANQIRGRKHDFNTSNIYNSMMVFGRLGFDVKDVKLITNSLFDDSSEIRFLSASGLVKYFKTVKSAGNASIKRGLKMAYDHMFEMKEQFLKDWNTIRDLDLGGLEALLDKEIREGTDIISLLHSSSKHSVKQPASQLEDIKRMLESSAISNDQKKALRDMISTMERQQREQFAQQQNREQLEFNQQQQIYQEQMLLNNERIQQEQMLQNQQMQNDINFNNQFFNNM